MFRLQVLFVLQLIKLYASESIFKDIITNDTYTSQVYNALPWEYNQPDIVGFNLPIIPIGSPFKDFDPCNEKSFNPEIFQPYLEFVVDAKEISIKNGWIALFDLDAIQVACGDLIPYHIFYTPHRVVSAQRLGASMAVMFNLNNMLGIQSRNIPPTTNVYEQTVFGIKITIPLLLFPNPNRSFYTDKTIFKITSQHQWSLSPDSIEIDANQLETIYQPYGVYHVIHGINGLLSLGISVYISAHIRKIRDYYSKQKGIPSKMAYRMRLLALLPEILANFVRFSQSVDPLGIFLVVDYFTARRLANLSFSLSTFTDFVTVFYCADVYNVYKGSREMNKNVTTFLVKYKYGVYVILGSAAAMIGVDQIVLNLGLHMKLGSDAVVIPVLYTIIISIVTVLLLIKISALMKSEVELVLDNFKTRPGTTKAPTTPTSNYTSNPSNTASATYGFTNSTEIKDNKRFVSKSATLRRQKQQQKMDAQVQVLKDKTENLLRFRYYVVFSAYGRIATIFALLLVGIGWWKQSALTYAASFLFIPISYTLSSAAQVLALLQLPHTTTTKKNNIGILSPHPQ